MTEIEMAKRRKAKRERERDRAIKKLFIIDVFIAFIMLIFLIVMMVFISNSTNISKRILNLLENDTKSSSTVENRVDTVNASYEDYTIDDLDLEFLYSMMLSGSSEISDNSSEEIPAIEEPAQVSFEEEHAYEIYALAKIIYAEAGCVYAPSYSRQASAAGIDSATWQQLVGYVVMNRVYQKHFPDSIESVFYSKGAYQSDSKVKFEKGELTEECIENATIVLENYYNDTVPVPRNLVYQAAFRQGESYLHVGNTYFDLANNLPEE